ncbi:Grx4 family monothiol glutaredoxin [Rickettsia endosymbiont of Cardiosporidium cionae]|nr:Grx4 family monothiol glutaredoxin [Rickettsia endosymbiont of Cardiosporidium cionae]
MFQYIKDEIDKNSVVLFMKGSKKLPQCGFSAKVVHILKNLGVDFVDHDVLQDEALRQGIKQFSDWLTIPQLYVKGEFIGGCDIVLEMHRNGTLDKLFKNNSIL